MSDAGILRAKAREAIQAGELPDRRPDRTWGGPGDDGYCPICSLPVKHDEPEIEMEFARDDDDPGRDNFHLHIRCFAAWESELGQMRSATPASEAGGTAQYNADTTVGRRRLPGALNGGSIADCGCDKTHKRGPG